MIKYQASVIQIGPFISEFINAGILVFFGECAPEELREFSIIHNGKELSGDLMPGDTIILNDTPYRILALGNVVNRNLSALGHLVVKFDGKKTVELPGDVCVENKPIPPVQVGAVLTILSEYL